MSLHPELRLMVYDAAMPQEIHLSGSKGSPGLPPTVRALMKVKSIREELIPHLFGRYHFQWTDIWSRNFIYKYSWDCFKRQALPFINSLSFRYTGLVSRPREDSSFERLDSVLRWARWRSLRPHLYPWHLKRLALVEAYDPFASRNNLHLAGDGWEHGGDRFLIEAPVVPGLDSLKIVLNSLPGEEAVRAFLERCASCEIDGRIGYCQYGQETASEWFRLQDNQVVHTMTTASPLEDA